MTVGDSPDAGKVNPHNGAVVRPDEDLFDSAEDMRQVMTDFGVDEQGARLLRSLGLV